MVLEDRDRDAGDGGCFRKDLVVTAWFWEIRGDGGGGGASVYLAAPPLVSGNAGRGLALPLRFSESPGTVGGSCL